MLLLVILTLSKGLQSIFIAKSIIAKKAKYYNSFYRFHSV